VNLISGTEYVSRNYSSSDRILLINAPVVETRYQWVRWNQPVELLKLSNFLKTNIGCDVKLYDFMLPANNKVTRTQNKPDNELEIDGYSFNLWRYGNPDAQFLNWLDKTIRVWRPSEIWVSSLTSYWWRGVATTIAHLKNRFSDIPVVLCGRYAVQENAHALDHSFADVFLSPDFELLDMPADFSLYEQRKPSFCALDVRSKTWPSEVATRFNEGIGNFVFFNDPLIDPDHKFAQLMKSFLSLNLRTRTSLRPKFYALCGLIPSQFDNKVARLMRQVGFVELHFEYETHGAELNVDSYRQVKDSLATAGYDLQPDQVSGFVYIGSPSDDLETIIRHMLTSFEVFGSVILKPWSPAPGTPLYVNYRDSFDTKRIERLSPHFFPFSQVNGISYKEYEELYVLAAALNQKVRSKAFDLFPGTLAYEMISSSFAREVWKIAS
jgi:hypothetical protein